MSALRRRRADPAMGRAAADVIRLVAADGTGSVEVPAGASSELVTLVRGINSLTRMLRDSRAAQSRASESIAVHGDVAATAAQAAEAEKEAAVTDALTGLKNRRALDANMADLTAPERRHQPHARVAWIMVDLDHFKAINDSFGHDEGDRVLRELGALLRDTCREADFPYRYGGEEFGILSVNASRADGLALAERIRARVAATLTAGGQPVTASLGVAWWPEHGPSPDALRHAADAALYRAKEGGRNRVEAAP